MSGTIEEAEGIIVMPQRQEIARVEQPNGGALTPMDMLNQAVAQGANMDVLEKLMTLQERWEGNQARRAFDEAITLAKAEMPTIIKNKPVSFGNTNYRHATLDKVIETVQPILTKHGLDARFRTDAQDGKIIVTCRISHKAGHSEENSLPAAADNSGGKNAIQAIGSVVTYLSRYTLMAALGLAAADDDDGRSVSQSEPASNGTVSDEQVEELMGLIARAGADIPKFCRYMKTASIAEMPASRFDAAVAALKAKEAKR